MIPQEDRIRKVKRHIKSARDALASRKRFGMIRDLKTLNENLDIVKDILPSGWKQTWFGGGNRKALANLIRVLQNNKAEDLGDDTVKLIVNLSGELETLEKALTKREQKLQREPQPA